VADDTSTVHPNYSDRHLPPMFSPHSHLGFSLVNPRLGVQCKDAAFPSNLSRLLEKRRYRLVQKDKLRRVRSKLPDQFEAVEGKDLRLITTDPRSMSTWITSYLVSGSEQSSRVPAGCFAAALSCVPSAAYINETYNCRERSCKTDSTRLSPKAPRSAPNSGQPT
jgi:hypothetical protein